MATHSSVLAWRIPGTGEPGWAAVYGVAQSRTRLKRLSSSSSSIQVPGRHTHLGQGLGSIQPTILRDFQLTRLKLSQSCSVVFTPNETFTPNAMFTSFLLRVPQQHCSEGSPSYSYSLTTYPSETFPPTNLLHVYSTLVVVLLFSCPVISDSL